MDIARMKARLLEKERELRADTKRLEDEARLQGEPDVGDAADAAVSVLVITGLVLARLFGWLWMDPLAGIVGAIVIASWSYGLVRDTSSILLDMNPDVKLAERLRAAVEGQGDRLTDLHLWRVGPGHLAAIVGVASERHGAAYYRRELSRYKILSHVTLEVTSEGSETSAQGG